MSDDESTEHGPRMVPSLVPEAKRIHPFAQAIRAAVPSGRRADIRALFHNRVTWPAIDHWRKGRRGPPQWAIECVEAKGRAILDPLASVSPGPGNLGKYNLPSIRAKKEAAI